MNEHGYLEIAETANPLTLEVVKEAAEMKLSETPRYLLDVNVPPLLYVPASPRQANDDVRQSRHPAEMFTEKVIRTKRASH